MKAKRLLFLVMAICLACGVKAQIYNSEVLFFLSENEKITDPNANLWIIQFKKGETYQVKIRDAKLKIASDNLKRDESYYECHSEVRGGIIHRNYTYDEGMSNEKWYVYSWYCSYIPAGYGFEETPAHTCYWAYKKDMSQMMGWNEPEGNWGKRETWNRLSKTQLKNLKFTGVRDFLQ